MLQTAFHRPVGDIGNPATFPFPVLYHVVEEASVEKVVIEHDQQLLSSFIEAAKYLEREGAKAITTSCGFLTLFQQEIQQELAVPFISSSLLQVPFLQAMGLRVGILTASKANLTAAHVQAVQIHTDTVTIAGMDEAPYFSGAIISQHLSLEMRQVEKEMQKVVRHMLAQDPSIDVLVLECTNMPPYRAALEEVTDLPIFDIVTCMKYIYHTMDAES